VNVSRRTHRCRLTAQSKGGAKGTTRRGCKRPGGGAKGTTRRGCQRSGGGAKGTTRRGRQRPGSGCHSPHTQSQAPNHIQGRLRRVAAMCSWLSACMQWERSVTSAAMPHLCRTLRPLAHLPYASLGCRFSGKAQTQATTSRQVRLGNACGVMWPYAVGCSPRRRSSKQHTDLQKSVPRGGPCLLHQSRRPTHFRPSMVILQVCEGSQQHASIYMQ
jgi:hypothetical protein